MWSWISRPIPSPTVSGCSAWPKRPHRLHYLELDDATCRARLHARNAQGEHDFAATDAEFDLITRHFCVPSEEEGLVIEVHRP